MKRFLLSSSAAFAIAVASTSAVQAQTAVAQKPNEKITLQLGGYFEASYIIGDEARGQKLCPIAVSGCAIPTGALFQGGTVVPFGGLVNEPGRGRQSQKVSNEGEIWFQGSTTLDNGLTIGVRVELEAMTSIDQIDESYITFSGSFGKVEFGSTDGVAAKMSFGAPNALPGRSTVVRNRREFQVGGNSTATTSGTGPVTTFPSITSPGDPEKVNYYSPRIAGFQFGIAYTPKNCEEANGAMIAANGSNQPIAIASTTIATATTTATGTTPVVVAGVAGSAATAVVSNAPTTINPGNFTQNGAGGNSAFSFGLGNPATATPFGIPGAAAAGTTAAGVPVATGAIVGGAPIQLGETSCGGTFFGFSSAQTSGQQADILDLSLNFVRKFGPVDIAANGFWVKGHLEGPTGLGTANGTLGTDRTEKGFGLNVAYMGFTLGGAYRRDNNGVRSNNTDRTDWNAGLQYETGPWKFGVEYGNAQMGRGVAGAGQPIAAGNNAGYDGANEVIAGIQYTMGPGITFYTGLEYDSLKSNYHNPANENDSVIGVVGTLLRF